MNHAPYAGWRKSSHSGGNGNCAEIAFGEWRKSSHSDANGDCVEVTLPGWRKSSYSNGNGNCVEIGTVGSAVGVRDSKQNEAGPVLAFTADEWIAFTRAVKDGEYDRP